MCVCSVREEIYEVVYKTIALGQIVCEKPLIIFVSYAQDRFLAFSPDQHPIVLQIGGSNLENLAKATKLADAYGYDEINFKLVCFLPS